MLSQLQSQYGCDPKVLQRFLLLFKENRQKLYYATKQLLELSLPRTEVIGCYLGQLVKDEIRLSVEGSQLLGPSATRNVLVLDDRQFHEWMHGRDVDVSTKLAGFVIISHGEDFCGCGKVIRDGTLLKNYLPKTRHVRSEDGATA